MSERPAIRTTHIQPSTPASAVPIYELVDLTTGSLIGSYTTEAAAVRAILITVELGHDNALANLALGIDDPSGRTDGELIAKGPDLLVWAHDHL